MERFKFTRIAHADHLFHSPISAVKLAAMSELLPLAPGARIVDFGCGNAEVLIRLLERFDARGIGVDVSPFALAEARSRADGRTAPGSLTLHERAALEVAAEIEACHLALCIGATDVFGGYRETLRALTRVTHAFGHLIVGEPFWKRSPDPAYLEALGAQADDYRSHAGNVALAEAEGLRFLYAVVSSEDDWDHYEGLYCHGIERYVATHPDDPDGPQMLTRIRKWRDLYLRFGRDTLGFALYLLGR